MILLERTIDRELKCDDRDKNLSKKACQKFNALARLAPFMDVNKMRIMMKAFIEYKFGYWLLVWMFQSRSLNNNTYNNKSSFF